MLEAGRALLARSLLAAVGGEARDGGPGAGGGGLAGLGVEASGKIELMSQVGAEELQVIRADPRLSLHRRNALLRMNCVVRIASSMALA